MLHNTAQIYAWALEPSTKTCSTWHTKLCCTRLSRVCSWTFSFSMLRWCCCQNHSQVREVGGLDAGIDVDVRPAIAETAATVSAAVASLIVASAATVHAILRPAATAMPPAVRPATTTRVQRVSSGAGYC